MTNDSSDELLIEVVDGRGRIGLNRPQAINAITHSQVLRLEEVVTEWADSGRVEAALIYGVGERGFCAGADVRALRDEVISGTDRARQFFVDEYRLNTLLASTALPLSVIFDGVTMGGGVGLGVHLPTRMARVGTRLAMPEVTIGLFPDVGVMWPMSRMPGLTGRWWALTGEQLDADSALWAGLVTGVDGSGSTPGSTADCWLARAQPWIDDCFGGDDPMAIVAALAEHPEPLARQTAALISSKSPLSVAVTLEALGRVASMSSLTEVLAQDLQLATSFVAEGGANSDLVEGIRAQVVDKDRQPRWRHSTLAEVGRDEVLSHFVSPISTTSV